MKNTIIFVLVFSLVFIVSKKEIYSAGEFTRIGAEAAGNKTGEIPAWEGRKGLKCPPGFKSGQLHPNPFRDEKPLFRIDHTNVDKYLDRLSPAQVLRLKKAKNQFMNIYPTHRIFEMKESYTEATEKNIKTAALDKNNILRGYNGGIPFPYPKNGLEAVWNAKSAWGGADFIAYESQRIVSPSGKIKKSLATAKCIIMDENFRLEGANVANPNEERAKLLVEFTYPPDAAGTAMLTITYIDDNRKPDTWMFMPALRRVRRVPATDTGYQSAGESIDGDLITGIAAPVNEWNWKLAGKKEIYIPANNYDVWKPGARDEDELVLWGINPALVRYELHRCWVVEATTNEKTKNHPYSKKVGYFDEDHWAMAVDDRYDRRGNLWRLGETSQKLRYCEGYRQQNYMFFINLESGRYEVSGGSMPKEGCLEPKTNIGLTPAVFTPQSLNRLGR